MSLKTIITCLSLCLGLNAWAQRHAVYADNIATLQVNVNNDWLSLPVMTLGSNDVLKVSFDELSHTYHRYTYHVVHCEADWTPSDALFTSDYLAGINGLTIDDFEESINTNQLYTHYTVQLPNDQCAVKMSGNYKLCVIDDETGDTALCAAFYVVEPRVNVGVKVLTDTDIDVRRSHQQVELRVDYPANLRVTDPRSQFVVKVMQNERVDNMVQCPPAPILMNGGMQWTHCRDLIFDAGNEYHKFEFLDPHLNSMGVDRVFWNEQLERYCVEIFHDYERRSYVYDEDANGAFYVRNSDNTENDITTDYTLTRLSLDTPKLNGDVYVEGKWTYNSIDSRYKLEYDPEQRCYTTELPLKMGYYSYQYLFVPYGSEKAVVCPTEGSFYETENHYSVLVYFRSNIDRTDRLVGYSN